MNFGGKFEAKWKPDRTNIRKMKTKNTSKTVRTNAAGKSIRNRFQEQQTSHGGGTWSGELGTDI